MPDSADSMQASAAAFRDSYAAAREMIGRMIVGHDEVVDGVLTAMLCGGHVLLEGVPGLGKTMLVRTLAAAMDLHFSRIQFTPDLMPADILGTNLINEDEHGRRKFEFQRGPVFTQILLADEINRATPKTQSAMLEIMAEGTVTAAGQTFRLEQPFFVLATQNPIEQEGTYPLPEAQMDRFLFKLVVGYSTAEQLGVIVDRTTRGYQADLKPVLTGGRVIEMRKLVRDVVLAPHVQDYLVRLTMATHPDGPQAVDVTNRSIRWGASPRGAQTLALASKVRALLDGRFNVSFEDLRRVYLPTMRHRVLLGFEAQAEGVTTDQVLLDILQAVPEGSPVG